MVDTKDIRRVDPAEAFKALSEDPRACLVDVRTRAEWTFVGGPDLSSIGRAPALIEWVQFPSNAANPDFERDMRRLLEEARPDAVYFICRSGQRSLHAAAAVGAFADEGVTLANVEEGFEGDPDQQGRRGAVNGWKARGLPWRQV